MKGLLDFDKSMKNARARYFLKSKSSTSYFRVSFFIVTML